MKLKIIGLAFILMAALGQSTALIAHDKIASAQNDVNFVDLTTAFESAKKDNKMVMIFFWTDWCTYCKMTWEKLFPDAGIKKALADSFISVSVDRDKNPNLAKKYKVRGVPTFIFLQPNGENIGVLPGYLEPPDFLDVLTTLQKKESKK